MLILKIIIDVESSTLEIKEAYPDDSGAYTVVIRNSLGQARSTTQLFVKEYLLYFMNLYIYTNKFIKNT